MPRRLSYAELEAEHRRARSQADVLSTVLNLIINTKPDHVERLRERDFAPPGRNKAADYPASYVFALYGATRADGGYAVVTFRAPGQSAWVTAHSLDDLVNSDFNCSTTPDGMLWKIAVNRLCLARSRALDAARVMENQHG